MEAKFLQLKIMIVQWKRRETTDNDQAPSYLVPGTQCLVQRATELRSMCPLKAETLSL
jgi:hypothetical protein